LNAPRTAQPRPTVSCIAQSQPWGAAQWGSFFYWGEWLYT